MKRFLSIILAIILACAGTFDTVLASEAAASDELPEGTKSVTVSYDRAAAVAYAMEFAEVDHNGIFKSMGLDCTNFVSQCMWSGYGGTKGYTLDNTAALKARVAANYRQTSTWYGRNADSPYQYGSGAFIRVVDFWDYVTTNTGYGPRATGYNNNKLWSQLTVAPRTGDIRACRQVVPATRNCRSTYRGYTPSLHFRPRQICPFRYHYGYLSKF